MILPWSHQSSDGGNLPADEDENDDENIIYHSRQVEVTMLHEG